MWRDRDRYREHNYIPDTFWLVIAVLLFAACGLVWLIGPSPAGGRGRGAARVSALDHLTLRLGMVVAAVIALCSYAVSATSLCALGRQAGYAPWQALAVPVVADGPAIYGMVRIISRARRGARGAGYGWLLVIAGTAASVAGNVAHAQPGHVARGSRPPSPWPCWPCSRLSRVTARRWPASPPGQPPRRPQSRASGRHLGPPRRPPGSDRPGGQVGGHPGCVAGAALSG